MEIQIGISKKIIEYHFLGSNVQHHSNGEVNLHHKINMIETASN